MVNEKINIRFHIYFLTRDSRSDAAVWAQLIFLYRDRTCLQDLDGHL